MPTTIHRHGRQPARPEGSNLLAMRDLLDLQIESADGIDLGRVDDVEVEIDAGGKAVVTALLAGPQALAGRVSSRLQPLVRRLLRDRFDTRIPMDEVDDLGLVIKLRGEASAYRLGASDRTVAGWLSHLPLARRPSKPSEGGE